jgi:L-seryl-tRNA(Ser) seleniumtransferase
MKSPERPDSRRAIPSVNALLAEPAVQELLRHSPRSVVTQAVRAVLERVRKNEAAPPERHELVELIGNEVARRLDPSLRPLFNATGVVLHTNLGRALLPQAAVDAIQRIAASYSNLEYDIEQGTRGSRYAHCAGLLAELTGAEDAMVVNNGAGALLLALNTLAEGKEVIVSRGELIEIGGNFRIPDIMAKSGAILREVGTTNRTHPEDYLQAIGERTGAIVKVHRSNFVVRGFTADVELEELKRIADSNGLPLLFDFGSGLLVPLERFGLSGEPIAAAATRAGVTLAVMSGDKLLGGPQAGLLFGRREAVAACRRNPLARALRVDKLTLAALEATLSLYREPERAIAEVPVLSMLTAPPETVRERALRCAALLEARGIACRVVPCRGSVGGGAFPDLEIESWAVSPEGDAVRMEEALRSGRPPVIGRIEAGRLLLDLRTLPPAQDSEFAAAVAAALGRN